MACPPSRVPLVRQHLTAAAVGLFCEALARDGKPSPAVERAAQFVDDALALLDGAPTREAQPAAASVVGSGPL